MVTETWSVRRVLSWTTQHFEKHDVDSPRLTAEVLLAHSLTTDRVRLYTDLGRPLTKPELTGFRGLIERRVSGEPTQYLTGVREFYNRPYRVDPRVLIPRPETELLVEAVLRLLPKDAPARVLDLCTGSGCIAISIAAERPLTHVTAVDLSPHACEVAKSNATTLAVADRVEVLEGDLFSPLPSDALFDVIVSNPPYVASHELPGLSREVLCEPKTALDGGPEGLSVVTPLIAAAQRWLKPGGTLALETGDTQGEAVLALFQAHGYAEPRVEKDLARLDRLAFGQRPVGETTHPR